MDEGKRVREPLPLRRIEPWQNGREVALVLRSDVLRLEEEDDLGAAVRDSVGRSPDDAIVREPDALVAPEDPRIPVGGLAHDVEPPGTGRRVGYPELVRADGPEFVPSEDFDDFGGPLARNRDLEIVVLPALAAEKQIDRPAGRDVPGRFHVRQALGDLAGLPGVPLREVGLEGVSLHVTGG
jgi:hypothetical protein